ncbi:MAG: thioredoxin family protein [Akkermansiaceae bacterium]|nr:thioredoxin family protein [Akkermansiaceae bacterium]
MIRSFLSVLFFAASSAVATAQFDLPFGGGGTTTTARLVAESTTVSPGMTVTLALELKHPEGWHSYYLNSGGIENSPVIEWTLPPGFSAGPIQWPVPEVKDGYSGKSLIYPGAPVLLVDLTAPADAKVGETVEVVANASWQICEEGCINEEREFKLSLPVAAVSVPDPAQATLFKAARARLPQPNAGWSVAAQSPDPAAEVVVRLSPMPGGTAPLAAPVEFIPNQKFLQPISAGGKVEKDGEAWVITLKRALKDMLEEPIPQGEMLSGIVVGGKRGTPEAYAVAIGETRIGDGSEPGGKAAASTAGGGAVVEGLGFSGFLVVLGGMLLGGLILNLMPCVFPVIGLKIMGFVNQAGDDRRQIIAHGLVFTLGVLVSFGVLSGILFTARAAGHVENWGNQLQNPWVVLVLMLLMFVLALNMFGLFEIGTSATSVGGSLQSKQGLAGSFFSGVLATVVATPCSGPFLGVAIGAAVGLPAGQFFTAFGAMAIGLSLPYLVLSAFPALIERLPRPGAWMESFKQGMSFLLFGTTAYLLWIYMAHIDVENMLGPVFGLTLIGLAAWVYGRWFLPHRKPGVRRAAVILALGFAVGGVWLTVPPKVDAAQSGAEAGELVWELWSQARVDELLKEGRPVYIDFTAKWCLTCQVNKKRAYTAEVVALMKRKNIVALRADKTKSSPEIDAKMRELDRSAIPVNVLLVPGKEPVITPEILSPGYLTELFNREVPDKETPPAS